MAILHAHSDPHFAARLRADANAQPHSVDIAVGYFYLSDLLATHPGKVRILIGRTHRPTLTEIAAGHSPRESDSIAGYRPPGTAGRKRMPPGPP